MILALDIGTNLGWAWGQVDQHHAQIWDHGVIKLPSPWGHEAAQRLFMIAHNFKTKLRVNKLIFEKVGGGTYNANRVLIGMTGILHLVYKDQDVVQFSPKTIKKYWTGNGNATKNHMVQITQMWHPDVTDDNESDAIAIWRYGTNEVYDVFD